MNFPYLRTFLGEKDVLATIESLKKNIKELLGPSGLKSSKGKKKSRPFRNEINGSDQQDNNPIYGCGSGSKGGPSKS